MVKQRNDIQRRDLQTVTCTSTLMKKWWYVILKSFPVPQEKKGTDVCRLLTDFKENRAIRRNIKFDGEK